MVENRVERILAAMKEKNLPHLVITDPVVIFYLTDEWIHPGERFLALYLHVDGTRKMVINTLLPQERDLGLELVWYNDNQDGVKILSEHMKKDELLGIDKVCAAGFLIKLQGFLPNAKCVNTSDIIDGVRQIKDEVEKEYMRESSAINDKVMGDLIPWVTKGLTEYELSAKVAELFAKYGVRTMSFDPITAYGRNAASPHHETDDSKGKRGDCVVLDIGGMYKNYASDMTRTVFIGEVSDRHREIYEIVKEANARGRAMAKPGNKMSDVDSAARDYIESKGLGKYFTHRTGHSIGLETHEAGDVSQANDAIIKVGQCFSVEPGIYIAEENIGVRIEDLVLITEDGCEVLNKYPRDLIVVKD